MNKKLRYAINAAISVGLIVTVICMTGVGRVEEQLSGLILKFFLLALVIENFGVAVSAKKWQMLFRMKDTHIPFLTAWKYYYIGTFFNAFLPTSVGGDAVKAYGISKKLERREEAFSSVIMDRLTGLIAVLGIGLFSLAFGWRVVPQTAILLCLPILILPIILLVIVFKTDFIGRVIERPIFEKFGRFKSFIEKIYISLKEYGSLRREIVPVILISFFYHFLLIIINYVLSISLGLNIPLYYFFIFIPVAEIIVFLPITVQGFGVREGTYVALFSSIGIGTAKAFSLGFSNQMVILTLDICGGFIYLFSTLNRRNKKKL